MKITICYYIEDANGAVEQTTKRRKAKAAFRRGLKVGEMVTVALNTKSGGVRVAATRAWKRRK